MSDAQMSPETGDGEGIPSRQSGLQLRDGPAPDAERIEVPDQAWPEARHASGSNGHASPVTPGPPAGAAEFDDVQPMLDLGLPQASDRPLPPPLHGEAPQAVTVDPVASSAEDAAPAPSPLDLRALPPSDTSATAEPDAPMEISPIFSALDAADRAAEAAQHNGIVPQVDAFEVGLLLPRSHAAENDAADPAGDPHLQGDPAVDVHEVAREPGDAPETDVAGSAEPPPPADDEPASTEENARPAERLQDAAARIAAEASATAAALENLKKLLVHKLPEPDVGAAKTQDHNRDPDRDEDEAEPENEDTPRAEPPPIPAYHAPVHLPVSPPPMVATAMTSMMPYPDDDGDRPSGVAVGGFLAGFALSWVFGAALYVYLTAG